MTPAQRDALILAMADFVVFLPAETEAQLKRREALTALLQQIKAPDTSVCDRHGHY